MLSEKTKKTNAFCLLINNVKSNYELYILSIPTLLYFIIFHYVPMYGLQIAFKDYVISKGFTGSEFIGYEHFLRFFNSYNFFKLIGNTLEISLLQITVGFPFPIILALLINEARNKYYKKTIQMITYAPHFISTVVIVSLLSVFLSEPTGLVNQLFKKFGMDSIAFMSDPKYFKYIYVWSGVWQNLGWGSIVYVAALSSIDPQLHEAAIVDGATKLKRIINIDLPGILPTAVILLILNTGHIMSVGFEKIYLMQNPINMISSDVISTYVYRNGVLGGDYSFSTAVGLFNSLVNFSFIIIVNKISKKLTETSLW